MLLVFLLINRINFPVLKMIENKLWNSYQNKLKVTQWATIKESRRLSSGCLSDSIQELSFHKLSVIRLVFLEFVFRVYSSEAYLSLWKVVKLLDFLVLFPSGCLNLSKQVNNIFRRLDTILIVKSYVFWVSDLRLIWKVFCKG